MAAFPFFNVNVEVSNWGMVKASDPVHHAALIEAVRQMTTKNRNLRY